MNITHMAKAVSQTFNSPVVDTMRALPQVRREAHRFNAIDPARVIDVLFYYWFF